MRLAVETLEELDWCLDQLESLQVIMMIMTMIMMMMTMNMNMIMMTIIIMMVMTSPCRGVGHDEEHDHVDDYVDESIMMNKNEKDLENNHKSNCFRHTGVSQTWQRTSSREC